MDDENENVVPLFDPERTTTDDVPVGNVLKGGEDLDVAVLIGVEQDGGLYIASSTGDALLIIKLLALANQKLLLDIE